MINENLNLIRKIVYGYVEKYPGLEFDDLFSEAYLACMEAEKKYNPLKGKESSFIWKVANNRLKTLINKEITRSGKNEEIKENSAVSYITPEMELIAKERWEELLNGLSPKAQNICYMVLNESELYLPSDKPKFCRGIIKRALKERGWAWSEIWGGFQEITKAVSLNP